MQSPFTERAIALTSGRTPLSIQDQAANVLVETGRAVVMLPTGSGKTLLAALPFAAGLLGPKQMVFMTPLRTLSDAQTRTLRDQIDPAVATSYLGLPWSVKPQTGSSPGDPLFTAPAVVSTFDQALSSALSIAYSASPRRRGINAGAVLGAYLVADEVHLYPRDEALTTLLWLLKHRPELPFLLMTATLSRPIADELAGILDARLIDGLPPDDVARLGVAARRRMVRWQEEPLSGPAIVAAASASPDGRVIVVVNTVVRAQEVGRELAGLLGWDRVMVLHSRFYPSDRTRIEEQLDRRLGQQQDRREGATVLVATQVVEAGLDVSAASLFSEWAPANSLVQRWGRCARWGGAGDIVIAPPPGLGDSALPIPYDRDAGLRSTLLPTREWLREHAASGVEMTTDAERALLDHAHGDTDRAWIGQLGRRLNEQASPIGEAIQSGLYSHAGGLIRRVDQRTVLVHGAPETIADPWHAAGFSLTTGTLHGLLRTKIGAEASLDDDEEGLISFELPDARWRLKVPVWDELGGERRAAQPSGWVVATKDDLARGGLFALNPTLASYDEQIGLRLLGNGPVPPVWWAPMVARRLNPRFAPYQRETLREHVDRMLWALRHHPVLWPTAGAIVPAVERFCGWPPDLMPRLVEASIVLHDAGKLSDRWQGAIRAYQRDGGNPDLRWLAHSDERAGVPLRAGPHALTGAALSITIGETLDREVIRWRQQIGSDRWDDEALPSRVLFTAIATHHGAQPSTGAVALHGDDLLSSPARAHLGGLLRDTGLPDRLPILRVGEPLHPYLVASQSIDHAGQDAEYVALTVSSRLLRLADGWSQGGVAGGGGDMPAA